MSVNDTEVEARSDAEPRPATAADRVRETADAALAKATDAYAAARERATGAVDAARDGLESNPVAAVVGGLAIGAILAAVLPKTRREAQLLGEWGQKLNDRAREAATSAKQAGMDKLDKFGVDAVKDKLLNLGGTKSNDNG